jgi:hypothetical protein
MEGYSAVEAVNRIQEYIHTHQLNSKPITVRSLRDWISRLYIDTEKRKVTELGIWQAIYISDNKGKGRPLDVLASEIAGKDSVDIKQMILGEKDPKHDETADWVLEKICEAIVELFAMSDSGKTIGYVDSWGMDQVGVPRSAHQAIAYLQRYYIEDGKPCHIGSVHSFIAAAIQPIEQWLPWRLLQNLKQADTPLIIEENTKRIPSQFCFELSVRSSSVSIEERLFQRFLTELRRLKHGQDEQYTAFRRFVIEHETFDKNSDLSALTPSLQQVLCNDFYYMDANNPGFYWIRPVIKQYWYKPGQEELSTYRQLCTELPEEVLVTLYPKQDACDISVNVGDISIGIDLKAWQDPYSLAKHINMKIGGLGQYMHKVLAIDSSVYSKDYVRSLKYYLENKRRAALHICSSTEVIGYVLSRLRNHEKTI